MRTNNTKKYCIFHEYRKVPNTQFAWVQKTTVHRSTHNPNDTLSITDPIKTIYRTIVVSFEHGSVLVPVYTDEKDMTELRLIKPDDKGPIKTIIFDKMNDTKIIDFDKAKAKLKKEESKNA